MRGDEVGEAGLEVACMSGVFCLPTDELQVAAYQVPTCKHVSYRFCLSTDELQDVFPFLASATKVWTFGMPKKDVCD